MKSLSYGDKPHQTMCRRACRIKYLYIHTNIQICPHTHTHTSYIYVYMREDSTISIRVYIKYIYRLYYIYTQYTHVTTYRHFYIYIGLYGSQVFHWAMGVFGLIGAFQQGQKADRQRQLHRLDKGGLLDGCSQVEVVKRSTNGCGMWLWL